MKKRTKYLLCAVFLLSATSSYAGLDQFYIGYGQGNDPKDNQVFLLGTQWLWSSAWGLGGAWRMSGAWDINAGFWSVGENPFGGRTSLVTVAALPILRIQMGSAYHGNTIPYFDAGIGPAFYTQDHLAGNNFGSSWGFQMKFGGGIRFGQEGRYDISYHYIRFMNFGIHDANDGLSALWTANLGFHFG